MRNPDPIDLPALRKKGFARILRWGSLVSLGLAVTAVAKLAKGDGASEVRIWIAVALGSGMMVLIAAGLMSFALLARSDGRRPDESMRSEKETDDDRP